MPDMKWREPPEAKNGTVDPSPMRTAVPELQKSVAFYRDQLGFTLHFEVEGWAFLSRDQFRLMLGECPDAMPASETGDHSYFAYVTVDSVDDLYLEFLKNGVSGIHEPADKPWRMREFAIRTPDGHRITFGQEINSDPHETRN